MAKVLTGAEVQEILDEYKANGDLLDYTEGPEQYVQMPPLLGCGYWRQMQLRPGLQLHILDVKKRQTHLHKIQHLPRMPLTFSYYLAGGCQVDNTGLKMPQEEVAGRSYLYCLPDTREVEEYRAGSNIRNIRLQVSPELIETFDYHLNELPTDLKYAIEHPQQALFYEACSITPAQQCILQQIIQWPSQGITRQFYLESKALELLALHFDQMLTTQDSRTLSANDIDRIHQAQSILIQNMIQPPSLLELARQVHLNDRKLKEGFRHVFGTTVFGYLRHHRMQQARRLLLESNMTVQETARCVGYASRSSFAAAFKKHFKVTPSSYLKGIGKIEREGESV